MQKKINLIWDMDGTLIDSYEKIINSLVEMLSSFGIEMSTFEALTRAKDTSVGEVVTKISKNFGLDSSKMFEKYHSIYNNDKNEIKMMKNASKTLKALKEKGVEHFIFTHNDNSIFEILRKNDVLDCFTDIITSENGFKRKPSPEAVEYLISKYNLDLSNTYYVGDRALDMECAKNANIRGIFLKDEFSPKVDDKLIDITIEDLFELDEIF